MFILVNTNAQTGQVAIFDSKDKTIGWVSLAVIAKKLRNGTIKKVYGIPPIEKATNRQGVYLYRDLGVAIDLNEATQAQQTYMNKANKNIR